MSDLDVRTVLDDLVAEQAALDSIVSQLGDDDWSTPTPSPRWSVADQVGHLTFFDLTASWAITDEDRFRSSLADMAAALTGEMTDEELDDMTLGEFRSMSPAELLDAWRTNRRSLADAASTLDEDQRVIWYGPSMGAKSFLTARLMECWAHGQHVVDAVGAEREATDRLRHIAQLGFITRKWTYVNRGLDAPSTPIDVVLDAPGGGTWSYGPGDADQSITGSAEDFCLVVTQCRHVDATDLVVVGDDARDWMVKAQAFAGGATDGPTA
ncbi:MAG: TIGR03084 family metal-binding protein [Actinomycetota bacterium]